MTTETNTFIQVDDVKELHAWLEKHIGDVTFPIWVIIFKKSSGKQTLTYEEIVEEALAFGLIDTQTKGVDADRYAICLRQRKPESNWTEVNKAIAKRLIKEGRMTNAGLKIYKNSRS